MNLHELAGASRRDGCVTYTVTTGVTHKGRSESEEPIMEYAYDPDDQREAIERVRQAAFDAFYVGVPLDDLFHALRQAERECAEVYTVKEAAYDNAHKAMGVTPLPGMVMLVRPVGRERHGPLAATSRDALDHLRRLMRDRG